YLQYQATHDETTGLLNRNGVRRLLSPLPSPQFVNRIAVFAADLDNFKRVNDSLGHEGGDELLSALAQRLTNGLPPTCTPARFYGDEFLVVCSDVQEAGGMRALTAQIAKILHTVVPVRGRLIKVSASIGAAVVENDRTTGEELVRYADAAMFEAKQRGQGFVERADPVLASTAASQLTLEEQLRHAIHNDSITMHYQPIVDNDGSVVLAEALLRCTPKSDEGPPDRTRRGRVQQLGEARRTSPGHAGLRRGDPGRDRRERREARTGGAGCRRDHAGRAARNRPTGDVRALPDRGPVRHGRLRHR